MSEITKKQVVIELLKSIENGDQKPIEFLNATKYIQHNLAVEDGIAGFGKVLSQLPKNSAKVNIIRVCQDGNYVFTHTDYTFFGPKIGFDVFKFENGKIVEHWDNLQTVSGPNPSNHSMIDGEIEINDLEKTNSNKNLVKQFLSDILVNGDMVNLPQYFDGDNYIQHNPQVPDQLSGLETTLKEWGKQGITMKYNKIHKILGEGNFVLSMSEGSLAGEHKAFYDLFRVENGKIAEHWDTIETIPSKSEWKNQNGKF